MLEPELQRPNFPKTAPQNGLTMRITATQIQQWADTRDAQGMLPVLIRKLIVETARLTELAMPGGDSVGRAGWDGVLTATEGNAWVPVGQSRWEMGCDKQVGDKAAGDYQKRTEEYGHASVEFDFVFVTPRRWFRKTQWRDSVIALACWRNVQALDADDLEVWLESAPATRLWFGELLGLRGPGIRSVESFWEDWRSQSRLALTFEAISVGREAEIQSVHNALLTKPSVLVVEADSTEEAVAFVCAQLVVFGHSMTAASVTEIDGWRYVETSPQLKVLVASSTQIAAARAPKERQMLVVPVNIGDRPDHFSAIGTPEGVKRITLERPKAEVFEKALITLGESEADAKRLSRSTGRSWTVYRRLMAKNPAIANPPWIRGPNSRVLSAIVLVGGWDESRLGDVALLEEITGVKYEELERELLSLSRLDDAPVLKIGRVWKAKAPLELLHLYTKVITNDEFRRYFSTAEAVLTKPDPALELDPDKRWMASVYGKVRSESGIVIKSIVDALAKLSVYAETVRDDRISLSVQTLVSNLLMDAGAERWLSLSGVLGELAEAAPETFLSAVERSLGGNDPPISRLFTENVGDAALGRNWHVNLLWALETLAWAPRHLGRVTDILARLCAWPVRENIMNRPMKTLASFFRPWWPQTTASLEMRFTCIDRVIARHNSVGWDLLMAIMPSRSSTAIANAKPHWRDDDAGAPCPGKVACIQECYEQIIERAIVQARNEPERIAALVGRIDDYSEEQCAKIIGLIEGALDLDDDGREVVRTAVRKYLAWHNTYNHDGTRADRTYIEALTRHFDLLGPMVLSRRHAWLFENNWIDFPDGRTRDHEAEESVRQEARQAAIREVFESEGWGGLTDLARLAGTPFLVGWGAGRGDFPIQGLSNWVFDWFSEFGCVWHDEVISGVLHAVADHHRAGLLTEASACLPPKKVAAFFSAAPFRPETWRLLEDCDDDVQDTYWKNISPGTFLLNGGDLNFAVGKLMSVDRHRSAFASIHVGPNRGDPEQLLALINGMLAGAEPDGPLVDTWRIGQAISRISNSGVASRLQLARIEFAYFDALQHVSPTSHLFEELLSDPRQFIELISIAFRPRNAADERLDESLKVSAQIAWSVLHHGRGLPAKEADGSLNRIKFDEWIKEVRSLGVELDRQVVTDLCIGQWLSVCGADQDGTWPCSAVRDLLDDPAAVDIRRGFHTGIRNNRGVHSRDPYEGGAQERDLAEHYRSQARAIMLTHPIAASVIEDIARDYDHQAYRQDDDSNLIREGIW